MLADICVVAVVAFFIYSGYRAGLMKSFIKLLSYIVAIIISFFLYPVLSGFLVKTPLYDMLVRVIGENYIMQGAADMTNGNTFGILTEYIGAGIESAAAGIAGSIALLLINILSFIIVLILSKFIIRIVSKIFNIFTKLPVIKQFNRLGGAVFGGAIGVLLLYIICAVIFLFFPFSPQSKIAQQIDNSVFASELYENNIILDYIGKGQ